MTKFHSSISTDLVRLLLKYAAEQSIKLPAIREMAGVVQSTLATGEERIPIEQFDDLWRAVVSASGDPDFGLHFGATLRTPPEGSILFSVMLNCRSLGKAIEKLARYHGLMTDIVQLHLDREDNIAVYGLEADGLDRHYVEAMLCGQVLTLRYLTEDQVRVCEVRFSHASPGNTAELDRVFRCPLVFGQPRNEIVLRADDLSLPIFLANPALLDRLESLAQEMLAQLNPTAVWTERVGRLVSKMLISGEKPLLDRVAYELAISARHLQNKLRDEGTTYRDLLEQLRRETALHYLQDSDSTICDIAFLLGYSDQSAFTNAFKRWTGHNPSDFR